jgi:hypothetical protein
MQDQNTSGTPAGQGLSVGRFVVTSIVEGASEDVDTFFRFIGGLVDHFKLKFASHGSVGPLPSDDDRTRLPLLPAFQPPVGAAPVAVPIDQVEAAIAIARRFFDTLLNLAQRSESEAKGLLLDFSTDIEHDIYQLYDKMDGLTPSVMAGTVSQSVPAGADAPLATPPEPAPVAPASRDRR